MSGNSVRCGNPHRARDRTPDTGALKLIYLVRRNPDLDRDRFVRRWRGHGSLGMSMDLWSNHRRYAHCDIRGELDRDGRGRPSDFDGFGMLWYQAAPYQQHASDAAAREALLVDERTTFAEMVATAQLLAEEHTSINGSDAVAVKIVRLIQLSQRLGVDDLVTAWKEYSRLLASDGGIIRHVLDIVVRQPAEGSPLRCDAIDEIGFCTLGALTGWARSHDVTSLACDDAEPLGSARVFVTNEVVLYDTEYISPL